MKPTGPFRGLAWRRAAAALLAGVILVALAPGATQAQSISVVACGKVGVRQIVAGSQLVYSQCGNRFTTAQPYVALIVELSNVRGRTLVAVDLVDPEQNSVWNFSLPVAPPEGQDIIYAKLWYWAVLPLGAEPRELVSADRSFLFHLLSPRGKPARERLGEWALKVSINNGPPVVRRFTLEAAPGLPTAAPPAPATPTPASTPEPTPSP